MKKILLIILPFLVLVLGLGYLFSDFSGPVLRPEVFPFLPSPTLEPINFALLADIHSDLDNLAKALERISVDQVDLVFVLGDLTNLGKKDDLAAVKKILDQSSLEYYVIPGNHDLWFGRQIKENVFRQVFSPDFQTVLKGNYKFILLNNGDDYLGVSGIDNQLAWLEKELKDCAQLDCLVLVHEPLNHPYSGHIMGENDAAVASEAAQLVQLLVKAGVKELFAGHTHLPAEYELEGLKTTIVGAISEERNPQGPNFLEVFYPEQKKQINL